MEHNSNIPTRDIFIQNPYRVADTQYVGIDLYSGAPIEVIIENARWRVLPNITGTKHIVKADRCAPVGDGSYSASWASQITMESGTIIKRAEAATIDFYARSTPGHPSAPIQCPEDMATVLNQGRDVLAVATIMSTSGQTGPIRDKMDIIREVSGRASAVSNRSYTPGFALYDPNTGNAERFSIPYSNLRGLPGESTLIAEYVEGDRRIADLIRACGSSALIYVPTVAVNMSRISLQAWIKNQLLKPAAGVSRTGNKYPMGTHIMNSISSGNYSSCAMTLKRSPTDASRHYLSAMTQISPKGATWTLSEAIAAKNVGATSKQG